MVAHNKQILAFCNGYSGVLDTRRFRFATQVSVAMLGLKTTDLVEISSGPAPLLKFSASSPVAPVDPVNHTYHCIRTMLERLAAA